MSTVISCGFLRRAFQARGYCLFGDFFAPAQCMQWGRLLRDGAAVSPLSSESSPARARSEASAAAELSHACSSASPGGNRDPRDPTQLERRHPLLWLPMQAVRSFVGAELGVTVGSLSSSVLVGCRVGQELAHDVGGSRADVRALLLLQIPPASQLRLCSRGLAWQLRKLLLRAAELCSGHRRADPATRLEVQGGALLVYRRSRCYVELEGPRPVSERAGREAGAPLALELRFTEEPVSRLGPGSTTRGVRPTVVR